MCRVGECEFCKGALIVRDHHQNCDTMKRFVTLHTILVGSVQIAVEDLKCWGCGRVTRFDGRHCAMFSVSRKPVYSRELLDCWLRAVAATGSTFREANEYTKSVSRTASARFLWKGGLPLSCNRRIASTAFAAYLGVIEYPSESKLSAVFTCRTCETRGEDGRNRFNALVMNGTATGVLGDLPPFDRPMIHINAAKGTAKAQYLVSTGTCGDLYRIVARCLDRVPPKDSLT